MRALPEHHSDDHAEEKSGQNPQVERNAAPEEPAATIHRREWMACSSALGRAGVRRRGPDIGRVPLLREVTSGLAWPASSELACFRELVPDGDRLQSPVVLLDRHCSGPELDRLAPR